MVCLWSVVCLWCACGVPVVCRSLWLALGGTIFFSSLEAVKGML